MRIILTPLSYREPTRTITDALNVMLNEEQCIIAWRQHEETIDLKEVEVVVVS